MAAMDDICYKYAALFFLNKNSRMCMYFTHFYLRKIISHSLSCTNLDGIER
jgi:hypothetical protein